ncbi:MAG: DUF58 domain-containing protein [Lachnospiraceae bacterium]|nr:DUF58 domain-containing protein [Lachnospiraceae bacterium]
MHILLIVVLVLLFIKGQTWVYNNLWDKKLNVNVSFSKRMVEEKEEFQVVEIVENGKKLPLPSLSVKFSTSPELVVCGLVKDENANVSDKFYYSDIVPAMSNTQVIRRIKCFAKKRGVYKIDSVYLSTENLFLNADMHEFIDNDAEILVYPKHFNLPGYNLPFNTLMGDIITKLNIIEDPFEFRGLRDYDCSDSMKMINWKASAKSEDYVVNQFNQTISKSVIIAVNFSQASGRFEDELLEDSLKLLVSIAEELLKAGFSVKFVSNAVNFSSESETIVEMGSGLRQMEVIHEATASIDADARVKDFHATAFFDELINTEDYLILISFNQDEKLVNAFSERIEQGMTGYWIVPVNYNIDYILPDSLRNFSEEWRTNENR